MSKPSLREEIRQSCLTLLENYRELETPANPEILRLHIEAVEDKILATVIKELEGRLPENWLADPKYRNLAADKDHSTDYFRALGHDQALDQVKSILKEMGS